MSHPTGMYDTYPDAPPQGEWGMSRLFFERIAANTDGLTAFCPTYIIGYGEMDAAWVTKEKREVPGEKFGNGRPKTETVHWLHEIEIKCSKADFVREFKPGGTKTVKWAHYTAAAAGTKPVRTIPNRHSVFLLNGEGWPLDLLPAFVGIYNVVPADYRRISHRKWNPTTHTYDEFYQDPIPGHRIVKLRAPKLIHDLPFDQLRDIAKSLTYRFHSRTHPKDHPEIEYAI